MKKAFFFVFLLIVTFLIPFGIKAGNVVCDEIKTSNPVGAGLCERCMGANPTNVWTALGCANAGTPNVFIGQILGWATIVGAGLTFLIIIYSGFEITTAAGDPKKVKAAQERLTSAIAGLLLIVFSIVLLYVIGGNILGLGPLGFLIPVL